MTKFVIDNGKNLFESYDKQEIDAIAAQKANSDDVYNKTVIDAIESGLQESIGAIQQNLADNYYQSSFIDTFFAKKNGDYDELTAGFAKQLISKVRVTDSAPYNFRTSGGSLDIGNREFDKLIGGSIAWNQLVNPAIYSTQTINDVTFTKNADGTVTVNGTASADAYFPIYNISANRPSRKYLLIGCPSGGSLSTYYIGGRFIWTTNAKTDKGGGIILNDANDLAYSDVLCIFVKSGVQVDNLTFKPNLIDLTAMFDSTIADYIYSLEQATAGAGVAWFKRLFNKPYYAYNAGELMSVKTSTHKMVGFNAWDEETRNGYYNFTTGEFVALSSSLANKNPIKVVPNTVYYGKSGSYSLKVFFYDADMNYIQTADETNKTFTTPANCYYINFSNAYGEGTTYNHDICINISWDGERNGEYEPYKAEYYPLAANLELRGIPKLDASNNLYYDGDEYEHTGDVTRKYGIVDLGSLNWAEGFSGFYSAGISSVVKVPDNVNTEVCLCIGYSFSLDADRSYFIQVVDTYRGWLIFRDSRYSSASDFKAAVSGKYLIYPLATPTTETAVEFANPQFVDDFGTEQYIDERPVAVPVGHVTEYEQNLRAKLEMSPDSPANDGAYLIQHNNGENSYIPYVSPIPALPTTNGVYSLKCTVTGGVPVLAWVEDTATRNAPDAEPETENENEK